MSKRTAPHPKQSRDVALCKKLGIDPRLLLEPNVQKAIAEHWQKVREALTAPIDLGRLENELIKPGPGSVGASRVNTANQRRR